jgi:ribosomal protein S7
MFSPLRRRVQTAVDRRFYRQKYDAQQVLAQFAQTARDETDMEALTDELVRVVQETMQPESMAVWFKTVERKVSHE